MKSVPGAIPANIGSMFALSVHMSMSYFAFNDPSKPTAMFECSTTERGNSHALKNKPSFVLCGSHGSVSAQKSNHAAVGVTSIIDVWLHDNCLYTITVQLTF